MYAHSLAMQVKFLRHINFTKEKQKHEYSKKDWQSITKIKTLESHTGKTIKETGK